MVAGSSPATPTKSDILKIEGHLIAPPLAEQKSERSGGQKGRGLGGRNFRPPVLRHRRSGVGSVSAVLVSRHSAESADRRRETIFKSF